MIDQFGQLFEHLTTSLAEEVVETLVRSKYVRIERIISHGQASPEGFHYDQEETEFLGLLQGSACIRFCDEETSRIFKPGDWQAIAPHRRHRVEWTSSTEPTIWLAIFYRADD